MEDSLIEELIRDARACKASDIHISEGMPVWYRVQGSLQKGKIQPGEEEKKTMLLGMMEERHRQQFEAGKDADFAWQAADGSRQRVNVFRQQRKLAAAIRLLNSRIPTLQELKLPNILYDLAQEPRGLILVTGPTGSGKSTTLAAMMEHLNQTADRHIITIEDPIEYVYESKKSLVGEMRDYETISAALLAAETGHLVLSTLHTTGAAQTVERIIDACPGETQNQVRMQLAGTLKGIISQCLIPCGETPGVARVAATELLLGTDAVLNLLREGKAHQLSTQMQNSVSSGMHTLNMDLSRLVREGYIIRQRAEEYSNNRAELMQYFS